MELLLRDLLDLAKLESRGFVIEPKPVAIDELIAKVLQVIRPLAAAKGLLLRSDVVSASVHGDPARLFRVFQNLLGTR